LTCKNLEQIGTEDLFERLRLVEESIDVLDRAMAGGTGEAAGAEEADLQAPILALQQILESLADQARRVAQACAHNRDNILTIVRAVGMRRGRVTAIAGTVTPLHADVTEELSKLQEVAAELQKAEADDRSRRSSELERFKAQEKELSALNAQVLALESDKASLEERIEHLSGQLDEGSRRLEEARAAIYGSFGDGEVESLVSRLRELDGVLTALQREVAARLV